MKSSSTRAGVLPASRVLVMSCCQSSAVTLLVVLIVQSTFSVIGWGLLSAGAQDAVGDCEYSLRSTFGESASGFEPVLQVTGAVLASWQVEGGGHDVGHRFGLHFAIAA